MRDALGKMPAYVDDQRTALALRLVLLMSMAAATAAADADDGFGDKRNASEMESPVHVSGLTNVGACKLSALRYRIQLRLKWVYPTRGWPFG